MNSDYYKIVKENDYDRKDLDLYRAVPLSLLPPDTVTDNNIHYIYDSKSFNGIPVIFVKKCKMIRSHGGGVLLDNGITIYLW